MSTCPRCRGTGLRLWSDDVPCGHCTDEGRALELEAAAERSKAKREERRITHAKFDGPGWVVLTSAGPWGHVTEILDEAKDMARAATELHLVPVTLLKIYANENALDKYLPTYEDNSGDYEEHVYAVAAFEHETRR